MSAVQPIQKGFRFLDATDKGCPESMKVMSIDQIRLLNQLHLAVGL